MFEHFQPVVSEEWSVLGAVERQDGRRQNEQSVLEIADKLFVSFVDGLDVVEIYPGRLAHCAAICKVSTPLQHNLLDNLSLSRR